MMQNESRNHDGIAAVSFIYIIKYNISRHSCVLVEEKTLNLVLSYLGGFGIFILDTELF